MSRIGRMPIDIIKGVDIKLDKNNEMTVKGPNGTLTKKLHPDMIINVEGAVINVKRPTESKMHKSLHGLTRSLINNMVVGVTKGFEKSLDIHGVGYRAQKQGKKLILTLGYSHPVEMQEPAGITIDVPANNKIIIKGADKQAVGELAAVIRFKRPPEVYKGKGVRYSDEIVRLKEGNRSK